MGRCCFYETGSASWFLALWYYSSWWDFGGINWKTSGMDRHHPALEDLKEEILELVQMLFSLESKSLAMKISEIISIKTRVYDTLKTTICFILAYFSFQKFV